MATAADERTAGSILPVEQGACVMEAIARRGPCEGERGLLHHDGIALRHSPDEEVVVLDNGFEVVSTDPERGLHEAQLDARRVAASRENYASVEVHQGGGTRNRHERQSELN